MFCCRKGQPICLSERRLGSVLPQAGGPTPAKPGRWGRKCICYLTSGTGVIFATSARQRVQLCWFCQRWQIWSEGKAKCCFHSCTWLRRSQKHLSFHLDKAFDEHKHTKHVAADGWCASSLVAQQAHTHTHNMLASFFFPHQLLDQMLDSPVNTI